MAGKPANNSAGHGGGYSGDCRGNGGHDQTYTNNNSKPTNKKVELCKDIKPKIINFGTKKAADLMRTMHEKILQYVRTKFGGNIANELQNRATVTIPLPTYPNPRRQRRRPHVGQT